MLRDCVLVNFTVVKLQADSRLWIVLPAEAVHTERLKRC